MPYTPQRLLSNRIMPLRLSWQVDRVALKVGGAKKMGAAGPATVTVTIASLPGIRCGMGVHIFTMFTDAVMIFILFRCSPASVPSIPTHFVICTQQGVPVGGAGRPPAGPVAACELAVLFLLNVFIGCAVPVSCLASS